jgi:hypothetical protein
MAFGALVTRALPENGQVAATPLVGEGPSGRGPVAHAGAKNRTKRVAMLWMRIPAPRMLLMVSNGL